MATQVWNSTLGFSILYSRSCRSRELAAHKRTNPKVFSAISDIAYRLWTLLLAATLSAWGVNIDIRCDFHHHAVNDTRSSLNKITSGGRIRSTEAPKVFYTQTQTLQPKGILFHDNPVAFISLDFTERRWRSCGDLGAVAAPSPRVRRLRASVADRQCTAKAPQEPRPKDGSGTRRCSGTDCVSRQGFLQDWAKPKACYTSQLGQGAGENLMPHVNAIKEQANFFPKNRLVVGAGTMEHVKNTGSLENTKVVMDLDADVFAKAKARVTKEKDPRVAQELGRFSIATRDVQRVQR
ncbi:hypothetical protein Q5P01_000331 [Channa striata]|uniref:Uncharacterized protein n=1 Tax=Channa striata TaxID=64152 RepID=A0AA88IS47_CHASR|nr:hypothetical protein Q5P01_000331 [Channa striata]